MSHNTLPAGCRLIDIPLARDGRGCLAHATIGAELPFPVARVFWIYGVPARQRRGGHAHRECHEIVFAVSGAVTMLVDDGLRKAEIRLDSPTTGLLVPAGVWCELERFAEDTVLVVLASHPYDAAGYIHDYEEYKEETRR